MAIKLKSKKVNKVSGVQKHRDKQVNSDFVHWVSRQVYYKGLILGGSENPDMKPKAIDANCQIHKRVVRDALLVLVEQGVITLEELEVPAGKEARAQDE